MPLQLSLPLPAVDDSVTPIPLYHNGAIVAYALVDAADAAWALQWQWHIHLGYAYRGRTIRLHRALLGLVHGDGVLVDHLNRDRLDNRRANLRIASPLINAQNVTARSGSSRYRGVSWDRTAQRWRAYARAEGRLHGLGFYLTEMDAHCAVSHWRHAHMAGAVEDPSILATPPPPPVRRPQVRGEQHGNAKYTEAQIREWRARYATGSISIKRLARDAQISTTEMSRIVRRLAWQHVA